MGRWQQLERVNTYRRYSDGALTHKLLFCKPVQSSRGSLIKHLALIRILQSSMILISSTHPPLPVNLTKLIVLHIRGSGIELEIALDDFLDTRQEVLLCCDLSSCSYGEHASLRANRAKFRSSTVGAES